MPNLHALLRSNGISFLFGIVYRLGNLMRLKRLKMKNPTIFADGGAKPFTKSKIMKKIICLAKIENFSQKTAESCGNLIFLTTFAKRLKIKELWLK